MAILHKAELKPTKWELLDGWLPSRTWYDGPATPHTERIRGFRFDDPEGEVGLEVLLVRTAPGGALFQVPLTYRNAPLAGAEEFLVGTTEHSVLGSRWVYDATGDPVFVAELAKAILTGGREADLFIEIDGEQMARPADTEVRGTGSATEISPAGGPPTVADGDPTTISTHGVTITLARVVDESGAVPAWATGGERLVGSWEGGTATLAAAR